MATLSTYADPLAIIDNTPIGQTTPAAGAFTVLKASTDPADEHGVGDRGFNDTRYNMAGISGIPSNPESGQYLVTGIRLDADKKIVITYNETPVV